MKWLIVLCVLAAVLAILWLVASWYYFSVGMVRRFKNPLVAPAEAPRLTEMRTKLHALPQEEVTVQSHDGLKLVGHYIPTQGAKRTFVLVHGWRSHWDFDTVGIALYLHEHGCNLLMLEQRSHGASEGEYITYGLQERHDCHVWADWCVKRTPNQPIFLLGVSMGASTVLMSGGEPYPAEVKGIIEDCGYISVYAIMKVVGKRDFHMPAHPLMEGVQLMAKLFAGVDIKSYSVKQAMQTCKLPILFIHGTADKFVPCWMGRENYMDCQSEKELYLVDGAGHAESYMKQSERYQQRVMAFVRRCESKE